ncbi:MAG: hypothetical protein LBD82_03930 [Deltaproteobacteria bacterium]|jgi:hypothetical protein|nr:hypothetical protein [Deltaproteobacteria bacterium]
MIYVIGDSHSLLFTLQNDVKSTPLDFGICTAMNPHPDFTVYHIGPATAYNINKEQSSNLSFEKIQFLLKNGYFPDGASVMISLGEIDMRAHVYKHVDGSPGSLRRTIDAVLHNYFLLVDRLRECGLSIICYGPPASMPEGRRSNPEHPTCGTEKARNSATEMFTQGLKEHAAERRIPMFSLFPYMINDDRTTRSEMMIDGCHVSPRLRRLAFKLLKKELDAAGRYNLTSGRVQDEITLKTRLAPASA